MKELRIAKLNVETRSEDPAESNDLVLIGCPIVFDEPTTINDPLGEYTEIISRGALDGVDLNDTRLLYNHDLSKIPLARAPKTMQLTLTEKGVEMRAVLADTEEARSVYTAVQRGDLDGMSFAFKVPEGGDVYDRTTNTRTINKIEKIYEISVVPFPAYAQTSVEARSAMKNMTDPKRDQVKTTLNKILFKGV